MIAPVEKSKNSQHIYGLDALRFVLATIVAIGHNGLFPLMEGYDEKSFLPKALSVAYNITFNGPACVIVFFVISGLCIHYPNVQRERLDVIKFFKKRAIRILPPCFIAFFLSRFTSCPLSFAGDAILWSVFCEIVYYIIYPAIFYASKRVAFYSLLLISYCLSVLVILTNPAALAYPSFGLQLNWLLGLPCWLLGCMLAEDVSKMNEKVWKDRILLWRLSALTISSGLLVLRFHSPIGYPYTLNLFAVFCYYWIYSEIIHFKLNPPNELFEKLGKWSYSLYLFHIPANAAYLSFALPSFGYILDWFFRFCFYVGCSYIFFLAFENPFYKMSKSVK